MSISTNTFSADAVHVKIGPPPKGTPKSVTLSSALRCTNCVKHQRECVFRTDKLNMYKETTKALAREFSRRSFEKGGVTKTRNKPNSSCDMCRQFNTERCIATFAEGIRKGTRAKLPITRINKTLGFENQSDEEDEEDKDDSEVASIHEKLDDLKSMFMTQNAQNKKNFEDLQENLMIILKHRNTGSPAPELKSYATMTIFELRHMEGEGDEDSIHAESEEEGDFFAEFEQESG